MEDMAACRESVLAPPRRRSCGRGRRAEQGGAGGLSWEGCVLFPTQWQWLTHDRRPALFALPLPQETAIGRKRKNVCHCVSPFLKICNSYDTHTGTALCLLVTMQSPLVSTAHCGRNTSVSVAPNRRHCSGFSLLGVISELCWAE